MGKKRPNGSFENTMRQKNPNVKHFFTEKIKKAFDKRDNSRYNISCTTMKQGIAMLLRLSKIIETPDSVLPFETTLDLRDLQFGGSCPVQEPVSAKGTVRNTAGVLLLDAELTTVLHGVCDRCAAEFTRKLTVPAHAVLTTELENEDEADEWTFLLEDDCADLDEILTTAFVLNMDSKLLCKPDCKGLCFRCGKNLNDGKCDCRPETDPRLAVLGQLLKDK